MRVDNGKLDLLLAKKRIAVREIIGRKQMSSNTLMRIRREQVLLPKTVGRLAAALGAEVEELIKDD